MEYITHSIQKPQETSKIHGEELRVKDLIQWGTGQENQWKGRQKSNCTFQERVFILRTVFLSQELRFEPWQAADGFPSPFDYTIQQVFLFLRATNALNNIKGHLGLKCFFFYSNSHE